MRTATMMLTAVLLLSSASIASAECAWVLWMQSEIIGPRDAEKTPSVSESRVRWTSLKSVAALQECKLAKEHAWNDLINRLKFSAAFPRHEVTHEKPFDSVTFYQWRHERTTTRRVNFRCLPDTIDPREKKE